MRNPDSTYINLLDRAEYMIENQVRVVNGYFHKMQSTTDPDFRTYCMKNFERAMQQLSGYLEMFDGVFRDYVCKIEFFNDEYTFCIEGR